MKIVSTESLYLSISISILLLLISCAQEVNEKPKKKKKSHLVEISEVKLSDISISRIRTGTLRARREIKIFTQEDGRINELPLYEGDKVSKGDVVARLDDKLLRAQLARTEAMQRQAQQDVERLRELFAKKLVPDNELARAETALEVALADQALLNARLEYATIKSPIDGVVSERLAEPGNVAERHAHLLTISDPVSLVTEVTVSELILPSIQVGDSVLVTIDALGNAQYKGQIFRIHPNLDPITRRGTIEVELQPVPKGAHPGQLSRIQLNTKAVTRLVIPFSGLRRDTTGEYVYSVEEGQKIKRTSVRSGLRIDEQVEIIEGLESGQQIVTKGFLGLKEGKKVKVVDHNVSTKNKKESKSKSEKQNNTNEPKTKAEKAG